jgi:hypothetical protein
MSSLSDPDNFGARPLGDKRYYGAERVGPGRWATLQGLGILWTNDADAVQLSWIPDANQEQANAIRAGLHGLADRGVPARQAFNGLAAEYGAVIETGDLATIG